MCTKSIFSDLPLTSANIYLKSLLNKRGCEFVVSGSKQLFSNQLQNCLNFVLFQLLNNKNFSILNIIEQHLRSYINLHTY